MLLIKVYAWLFDKSMAGLHLTEEKLYSWEVPWGLELLITCPILKPFWDEALPLLEVEAEPKLDEGEETFEVEESEKPPKDVVEAVVVCVAAPVVSAGAATAAAGADDSVTAAAGCAEETSEL